MMMVNKRVDGNSKANGKNPEILYWNQMCQTVVKMRTMMNMAVVKCRKIEQVILLFKFTCCLASSFSVLLQRPHRLLFIDHFSTRQSFPSVKISYFYHQKFHFFLSSYFSAYKRTNAETLC